jgi:hypothetical protein
VSESLKHFLILYDVRERGVIEPVREFARDDESAAVEAYQREEDRHRGSDRVQVLLISSDSLDTVKHTHRNFFSSDTLDDLVREVIRAS